VAKGNVDRTPVLPKSLMAELQIHIVKLAQLHKTDSLMGMVMRQCLIHFTKNTRQHQNSLHGNMCPHLP